MTWRQPPDASEGNTHVFPRSAAIVEMLIDLGLVTTLSDLLSLHVGSTIGGGGGGGVLSSASPSPQNERDGLLRGIADAKARESVLIDFKPLAESKTGELTAHFELVIGLTPEEPGQDRGRKGSGGPPPQRPKA